jgi:hypothetical protein
VGTNPSLARKGPGDAKRSVGDAKSSLGDAENSLGDAKSSLGDAKSSLGDAQPVASALHETDERLQLSSLSSRSEALLFGDDLDLPSPTTMLQSLSQPDPQNKQGIDDFSQVSKTPDGQRKATRRITLILYVAGPTLAGCD